MKFIPCFSEHGAGDTVYREIVYTIYRNVWSFNFFFFYGLFREKECNEPPPPPEYGAAQLKRYLHKFRVEGGGRGWGGN